MELPSSETLERETTEERQRKCENAENLQRRIWTIPLSMAIAASPKQLSFLFPPPFLLSLSSLEMENGRASDVRGDIQELKGGRSARSQLLIREAPLKFAQNSGSAMFSDSILPLFTCGWDFSAGNFYEIMKKEILNAPRVLLSESH